MQQETLKGGWANEQVKESLDLCLSCKACKSECPVSVDVATYKAEFLAHHYATKRRPLSHYAFGRIDRLARLAGFAPGLVNAVNGAPGVSGLMKRVLHLHPERTFPRFARPYTDGARAKQAGTGKAVLLFADTFNNYFHPQALYAANKLLSGAGYDVQTPRQHLCCGRPLYDFGLLNTAKAYLLRVLDALEPQLKLGMKVVVLEPSCASVFKDELCNLFPNDPRAAKLRDATMLLSEFLVQEAQEYVPPRVEGEILLHGHCHHRATFGMADEVALLKRTGATVNLLDSGCCGMAGPFGFEKDKYEISQALGNRVLLPAVRAASAETVILTDGFSCAQQITQNTKAKPMHLAEVLAGRSVSDQ